VSFSQAAITELRLRPSGGELLVSWSSTSPAGTTYQVYLGRRLAWWGKALSVRLPMPQSDTDVEVGAVADGEGATDFSAGLPTSPADRVDLEWPGGTYLDDFIAGFRVFGSDSPGGAVDYGRVLAEIPAYTGAVTDGFGLGGFGDGGFGRAASYYAWTTPRLSGGTWAFAVVPFDTAGNQGDPDVVTVTCAAPPLPPAPDPAAARLTYSYDPGTRVATLHWLPSPG
jgi:hypothetical protein